MIYNKNQNSIPYLNTKVSSVGPQQVVPVGIRAAANLSSSVESQLEKLLPE